MRVRIQRDRNPYPRLADRKMVHPLWDMVQHVTEIHQDPAIPGDCLLHIMRLCTWNAHVNNVRNVQETSTGGG